MKRLAACLLLCAEPSSAAAKSPSNPDPYLEASYFRLEKLSPKQEKESKKGAAP